MRIRPKIAPTSRMHHHVNMVLYMHRTHNAFLISVVETCPDHKLSERKLDALMLLMKPIRQYACMLR